MTNDKYPVLDPASLRPGDTVRLAVPMTGRIGADGRVHLSSGVHLDPAVLPLSMVYPADHPINDPLFTVRRAPGDDPDDPHARRAFLLPFNNWACPWLDQIYRHEMGHDEVLDWVREDFGQVQALFAQHLITQPGCFECRPWLNPERDNQD